MVRIKWLDSETTADGRSVLILPGAGYTEQAPLLYWSVAILLSAGWRVGAAVWEDSDREFADPYRLIDRAIELHASEVLTLPDLVVAKSLGTLALPHCISAGIAGVWLTPLLNKTEVATALLSADRRHLAIGGTKDRHWKPETVQGTNAKTISLDEVDHALLHDDWRTSMKVHTDVASEIAAHVRGL